jgi:hypothetical protein
MYQHMYQLPITLNCSTCLRDYARILNLPNDCIVSKHPPFSCAPCTGGERYHAPDGMSVREWIAALAGMGWRCGACGVLLDVDSVRNLNGAPACARCRGRARMAKLPAAGLTAAA